MSGEPKPAQTQREMELDELNERLEEDSYLVDRNILLRSYQINLLRQAEKQNSIIYLPTGAGKTLIAIHVLCSRTQEIRRPFNEGGKVAFFVATTKVMVHQIARVVKSHTKFRVMYLTGDMNVDLWSRARWLDTFQKYQVLILTGEILKTILQLQYISPSNISLVVFDECHHAANEHPYKLIMQTILEGDSTESPLILGLSGILLKSTPKLQQVEQTVRELETSLNGKIITEGQLKEVISFSADPVDRIVFYKPNSLTPVAEVILNMYERLLDTLKSIQLTPTDSATIPFGGKEFKNKNRAKRLHNSIANSRDLMLHCGLFSGSLSVLLYIIHFEKFRLMSGNEAEEQLLIYVKTELIKLRRVFHQFMGEEETEECILGFSSPKVRELLFALKEAKEKGYGEHLSILIFVKQRVTAVVLAFLLKRLKACGGEFSFLKPEFMVGTSIFQKESLLLESTNEEIIRKFASHAINVLVATNLLEEGIDISACNLVISFDFPSGYSSYFQSRGRARNKESTYIMFAEETEKGAKCASMNNYKELAETLHKTVSRERDPVYMDESSNESFSEALEKMQLTGKTGTISVDGITAIKIVTRYCQNLPQDKYSNLGPVAWYTSHGALKKAFVRLPINSPLRGVIEGEPRNNSKDAKRSAFLHAVKALFEIGELDETFNVKSRTIKIEDYGFLFPHYKKEDISKTLPQPGTSKRKQVYKMKFAESLSRCLPRPGEKVYLHVIQISVAFQKPSLERKIAIYETLDSPSTYALLSSKKLCKILRFPVHLSLGQMDCDLLVNYDEMVLTEAELDDIKQCHFALFKKVTKVLNDSQIFDNRNEEHSFYVVPVQKNDENRYVINWNIVRSDYCRNTSSALVRYNPSSIRGMKRTCDSLYGTSETSTPASYSLVPMDVIKGRSIWGINQEDNSQGPKFLMTDTDYKYFIIFPNYRNQESPQRYIVNKICNDMSPLSPFPRLKFPDYVAYFKETYEVDITNGQQPLLRVSPIFSCFNMNKPRKRKDKEKGFEEHLVPELCDVIPFDKKYYLKALLLPTILNRIYHVYCVEEFRRRIVAEAGLGKSELPEGKNWSPLDSCNLNIDEDTEEGINSAIFESNIQQALPLTKLKDETLSRKKVILDPERHMYEVGLCDLEYYVNSLKDIDPEEDFARALGMMQNDSVKYLSSRDALVPSLVTLSNGTNPSGPDLAQLVQASTSTAANDLINYERLEILGDSLLKFAASVFLFRNFTDNEGILTILKGKIVGNRNLLYCALEKGFQDIINVHDFVPSDWNPPLFCVPGNFVETIVTQDLDSAVIHRFEIPLEEQFSGVLSENTIRKNENILRSYEKRYDLTTSALLPYKIISDKIIADSAEAFIGAYLLALGLRGAFDLLRWLDILPEKASYFELIASASPPPSSPANRDTVMFLLNQVFYTDLEQTLNYRFNNKAFLLEAITHPSYEKNNLTDCYQRLEFLGDAILDFLITSYVYQYCGDLTPGQVTDIRSSLVNNLTFACLTVRYELHKFLLFFSSPLSKAIDKFVSFQASRNHVIDDNIQILLEERDYAIAETVQVPKALGDIFESLAGAIYLDSGNSLAAVWNVYYALMKRELDEFTKTVPKTPVRLLHEICGDKPFFESQLANTDTVMVSCTVYYNNEEIKGFGFGPNKKEAKKSAVKVALNKILLLKKRTL